MEVASKEITLKKSFIIKVILPKREGITLILYFGVLNLVSGPSLVAHCTTTRAV